MISFINWIPVSQTMPDDGIEVLVAFADGETTSAFREGEQWRYASGASVSYQIVAWADLPEFSAIRAQDCSDGRQHRKPEYLETGTEHRYLIDLPWVATSGDPRCPCEWNNGAHAAIHSLITALRACDMQDVKIWLHEAQRQVRDALRTSGKVGAQVPVVGEVYPYLHGDDDQ